MAWKITYWNNTNKKNLLEKWFDNLSAEELKSIAKELKMLALSGNLLKMPHSKALGQSLFELRERKFGYRLYYVFYYREIIIVAAGNKKTQEKDIKNARIRLKTIQKDLL